MATSFRSGKNERVCDDVSDRDNDITFWYRNRKNANLLYVAPEQSMPWMQLHRYKQGGAKI